MFPRLVVWPSKGPGNNLRGVEMINGRGKQKKQSSLEKSVFSFWTLFSFLLVKILGNFIILGLKQLLRSLKGKSLFGGTANEAHLQGV